MTQKRQIFDPAAPTLDIVEYEVPREFEGERADRFLCWCVPRLSRDRAKGIVKRGGLRAPDGRQLKPSSAMRAGWRVRLVREAPDALPSLDALRVIHEDPHLLVVDKPGDLTIHRTATAVLNTLTALLARRYGEQAPHPAHRLDRETSGLVVCGRRDEEMNGLVRQFEGQGAQKTYLAIVEGVPDFERREIDIPIMLDPDNEVSVTMCVHPEGLPSQTEVERLKASAGGRSLLRVRLKTGRQHQIRVHLAAIGLPIVGDKLYGPDHSLFLECIHHGVDAERAARLGHHRHALHATHISLKHPGSGERVSFESPLPAELEQLLGAPALKYESALKIYPHKR